MTPHSTTNGAHVEVTLHPVGPERYIRADPLYVAPDPCHTTGRVFPNPLIRDLLRAFGVLTCPDCHRFTGMAPRIDRPLRRKGTGWRERP